MFGDRYKSILVEEPQSLRRMGIGNVSEDYLANLIAYVHLKTRAALIDPEKGESIPNYCWSSLAMGYAMLPSKRAAWLEVSRGLEVAQWRDTAAGRRENVDGLDRRILAEKKHESGMSEKEIQDGEREIPKTLRRGWYWGSQAFGEWLLEKAGKRRKGKAGTIKVVRREPIMAVRRPSGS